MITIRYVVKFGGTSIQDVERMEKATQAIIKKRKEGNEIIVVVSAMGDTTDNLISLLDGVTKKAYGLADYAEFVSFGERMSARLLVTSLKANGFDSAFFEPAREDFPIITKAENILEAEILPEESKKQCLKYLEPLLKKGVVPVVCGFLGRSVQDGAITCLGRGGSDVTAFALANFVQADEVIIVTDAMGVASADPRIIKKVETLPKISVEEMGLLAEGGAQVLHPRALNFKESTMKAKIIHFQDGDLDSPGTEIEGSFTSRISVFQEKLCLLTIVGEKILETSGILKEITASLSKYKISIQGIAMGLQYIGIYVYEKYCQKAYDLVHPAVLKNDSLKSVTSKKEIALIVVSSRHFIDTPGIIEKISRPLAEHHINILEMTTIKTDILIFVDWKNKDIASQLISDSLTDIGIIS
ncbi:MAG: aspartate kinase [Atribacterota bacterium]|nr:aspartate kinase [Atribacterota bacterium]